MGYLKYFFWGLMGGLCVLFFELDILPRVRRWWMRRQLRILEPKVKAAKEDLAMLSHLHELENDYRRGMGL